MNFGRIALAAVAATVVDFVTASSFTGTCSRASSPGT